MKYIRTKDGIYEKPKDYRYYTPYEMVINEIDMYKGKIVLKQADTIEELCDEFVIEFEGCVPFTSDIFYIDEEHRKDELKPLAEYYKGCKNIFGAIWTDKGLIYVAKLNDKGDLELI